MKNKIIYRIIISYILAVVFSFFLTSFLNSHLTYKHFLKEEQEALYREANYIAGSYVSSYYNRATTTTSMEAELRAISLYIESDIMFIATDGNVIIDTGNKGIPFIDNFDLTNYADKHYTIDTFFGMYDSKHLSVYYPVVYNFTTRGYVVISKPVSLIRSKSDSVFLYNYITLAVCYIILAVILVYFNRFVSKPVNHMIDVITAYAKGNFANKINLKRNDEIGRLAASLDYMASEFSNVNEYQKKFITNISHDFRSPLTSIKGYLEAMLDGTIPLEMQEKYLKIVISETERLTTLTNNILTVNTVSDKGTVLDIQSFDITKVIKSTIETFQGECEKKKIHFKLLFSEKTLNVLADKTKIEQVIYNLIDNAIKFSSNDSSIIVSASEKGDQILISVKDFGIGIPKESIPKIWDRFYKSDLSRGKDKKGSGLGLAIVKEIIVAHNEYIDVISTEGVGTEFIFALPKDKESRTPFLELD